MKFRTLAIATVFASLMGTAALNANAMTTDRDHLNGYSKMTYRNIYMDGGEKAAVAVSGAGNAVIRLSVYDYNNNLITNTTCQYTTCVLSWTANWNANFYVTVENLSSYGHRLRLRIRPRMNPHPLLLKLIRLPLNKETSA